METLGVEHSMKRKTYLNDLVDNTISEDDKNKIIKELELGGNVAIFGRKHTGKTTMLEAVIREHLSLNNHDCNFYLTNSIEIDFSGDTGVIPFKIGLDESISIQNIATLLKHNANTIVFNEINSQEGYDALEYAIYNGIQVVLTCLGGSAEEFEKRMIVYLGAERSYKLIKHFPLLILCEHDLKKNYIAKVVS